MGSLDVWKLFGVVFTKCVVCFGEEISDFRLCCGGGALLCNGNLTIYCISALVTQHIESVASLQLVTFGYMFRLKL